MNRTERLTAILDILAADGQVEVDEIVLKLGVSPATARRDLDSLANERLLTRTRGGATSGSVSYDLPGRYNRDDHAHQKQQIAHAASALIPKGAVIGLCGGTTSTALAQVLSTREFDVLRGLVDGLTLDQIAERLHLSPKTVSNYQTQIRQRLGVATAVELLHYARAHRLFMA